jgi:hypothetical protein
MEDKKKMDTKKQEAEKNDNPTSQPDPETLHKTDPQESMQGPLSSLLNKQRESIEKKGDDYVDGEEEKKDEDE